MTLRRCMGLAVRARITVAMGVVAAGCGPRALANKMMNEPARESPQPSGPDRDADGVADEDDQCPDYAEDRDDFEDDDGCPDPDNDRDRILDAEDRCPNQPENYNGCQDEDGCPEVDHCNDVVLAHCNVHPSVYYFPLQRADATLPPHPDYLATTTATIRGQPSAKVAIIGHADPGERHPGQLAAQRARHVRELFVAGGVAPAQIVVFTAGSSSRVDAHQPERNARAEVRLVAWDPTQFVCGVSSDTLDELRKQAWLREL